MSMDGQNRIGEPSIPDTTSTARRATLASGLALGLTDLVGAELLQRGAELQTEREQQRRSGRSGPVDVRRLRKESSELCAQALRFLELNASNACTHQSDSCLRSVSSAPDSALLLRMLDQLDERELLTRTAAARWPTGFACPSCAGREGRLVLARRAIRCSGCGRFSGLFAGTSLANSHVGLKSWLRLAWALIRQPDLPLEELARFAGLRRAGTVARMKRQVSSLPASANAIGRRLALNELLQLLVGPDDGRQAQGARASTPRKDRSKEDQQ